MVEIIKCYPQTMMTVKKNQGQTYFQIIGHGQIRTWFAHGNFKFGIPITTGVSNTRLTGVKVTATHMIGIIGCTLITGCYWLQKYNYYVSF